LLTIIPIVSEILVKQLIKINDKGELDASFSKLRHSVITAFFPGAVPDYVWTDWNVIASYKNSNETTLDCSNDAVLTTILTNACDDVSNSNRKCNNDGTVVLEILCKVIKVISPTVQDFIPTSVTSLISKVKKTFQREVEPKKKRSVLKKSIFDPLPSEWASRFTHLIFSRQIQSYSQNGNTFEVMPTLFPLRFLSIVKKSVHPSQLLEDDEYKPGLIASSDASISSDLSESINSVGMDVKETISLYSNNESINSSSCSKNKEFEIIFDLTDEEYDSKESDTLIGENTNNSKYFDVCSKDYSLIEYKQESNNSIETPLTIDKETSKSIISESLSNESFQIVEISCDSELTHPIGKVTVNNIDDNSFPFDELSDRSPTKLMIEEADLHSKIVGKKKLLNTGSFKKIQKRESDINSSRQLTEELFSRLGSEKMINSPSEDSQSLSEVTLQKEGSSYDSDSFEQLEKISTASEESENESWVS